MSKNPLENIGSNDLNIITNHQIQVEPINPKKLKIKTIKSTPSSPKKSLEQEISDLKSELNEQLDSINDIKKGI